LNLSRLWCVSKGRFGQVVEVRALTLVEVQSAGKGFHDGLRRAGVPALFEARVVVDADTSETGHFLAPKARDPSTAPAD
jgi:hypothetical protein